MNEFKAGMQVYSPTEGSQVFEVVWRSNVNTYQIGVGKQTFTKNGMAFASQNHPSIFHATKENQALLESLYGVKFDDPPLSDKEKVIEALKNANGKPVLCWVSNSYEELDWCIRAIGRFDEIHGFQLVGGCYGWEYAKPLSPDEFVLA